MKKIFSHLLAGGLLFTVYSCTSTKYVSFVTKDDDLFSSPKLKDYMTKSKEVSVVVRVPNPGDNILRSENSEKVFRSNSKDQGVNYNYNLNTRDKNYNRNFEKSESTNAAQSSYEMSFSNSIYNTIEKEFSRSGFAVRDRTLFSTAIGSENMEYSKMRELTNTDFIIEVLSYNKNLKLSTNKIREVKKNGSSVDVLEARDIVGQGMSVEYKIVAIKTNEVLGTYKFYYNPCPLPDGCLWENFNSKKKALTERNGYDLDAFEMFVQSTVKQLIQSFKGLLPNSFDNSNTSQSKVTAMENKQSRTENIQPANASKTLQGDSMNKQMLFTTLFKQKTIKSISAEEKMFVSGYGLNGAITAELKKRGIKTTESRSSADITLNYYYGLDTQRKRMVLQMKLENNVDGELVSSLSTDAVIKPVKLIIADFFKNVLK